MFRITAPALLALLLACSGSELRTPTGTPPDTTGGGGVQRATVRITIGLAPEDRAVTDALGWTTVAGATVVLQRQGSTAPPVTAVSDPSGVATFTGVLPGPYTVSLSRPLSPIERARLGAADGDVDAFGGGGTLTVAPPNTQGTISAAAGRRGSLVISEIWMGAPFQSHGGQYVFGHWVEFVNNSDTAIALAGKLFFHSLNGWYDHPSFPCSRYAHLHGDTAGIWASRIYQFPPDSPPLQPGEVTFIATDAIDHTKVATGTYDLSSAPFEFRGPADVDNPASRDMLSVGPRDGGYVQGHGLYFVELWTSWGVAAATDLASLPRVPHPDGGFDVVRLPGSALLDLIYVRIDGYLTAYPRCQPPISAKFDPSELVVTDLELRSFNRQRIPGTARTVLLRTRTSARDFLPQSPSPGTIP